MAVRVCLRVRTGLLLLSRQCGSDVRTRSMGLIFSLSLSFFLFSAWRKHSEDLGEPEQTPQQSIFCAVHMIVRHLIWQSVCHTVTIKFFICAKSPAVMCYMTVYTVESTESYSHACIHTHTVTGTHTHTHGQRNFTSSPKDNSVLSVCQPMASLHFKEYSCSQWVPLAQIHKYNLIRCHFHPLFNPPAAPATEANY